MLELGQVREVVTDYIRSHDLVAKDNPRFDFVCEGCTCVVMMLVQAAVAFWKCMIPCSYQKHLN